jgi:hypothetical protein
MGNQWVEVDLVWHGATPFCGKTQGTPGS